MQYIFFKTFLNNRIHKLKFWKSENYKTFNHNKNLGQKLTRLLSWLNFAIQRKIIKSTV